MASRSWSQSPSSHSSSWPAGRRGRRPWGRRRWASSPRPAASRSAAGRWWLSSDLRGATLRLAGIEKSLGQKLLLNCRQKCNSCLWKSESVEVWKCRSVDVWKFGSVEVWKGGSGEVWHDIAWCRQSWQSYLAWLRQSWELWAPWRSSDRPSCRAPRRRWGTRTGWRWSPASSRGSSGRCSCSGWSPWRSPWSPSPQSIWPGRQFWGGTVDMSQRHGSGSRAKCHTENEFFWQYIIITSVKGKQDRKSCRDNGLLQWLKY